MDMSNFDDLLAQGRQIAHALTSAYEEATGEEFDLESGIRHYPLAALGIAVGTGALAGWWLGHRTAPQLPSPAVEQLQDIPQASAFERLEQAIPETVSRLREALPEITVSDEVKERMLSWASTTLEKQFQQNVDSLAETLDARLSGFFRRGLQRLDSQPEVKLDDPVSDPSPDTPAASTDTSTPGLEESPGL